MDKFGRLIPAPEEFSPAANGQGFKPLADYIHVKGFKFEIHMIRDIPRQAVRQNTPIWRGRIKAPFLMDIGWN